MTMLMEHRMYSIGEVSQLLGIEQHTLRYWEKEFKDFLRPRRVANKNRVYGEDDLDILRTIQSLLNVELFTIAGARRQMYMRSVA
jgi:DNA-binding transcriptional MerR regulator